ncbi:MAG: HepT-like ribonuclease domain-containing protein [Candidatus Pacearchaeota archaeon]
MVDLLLQEHLAELKQRLELWQKHEKTQFKEFLEDIEVRDKIMHNMLIAIQSAIDIGEDLIRLKNLEIPSTYKDIFIILEKHNIIEKPLAQELERLAGL